MKQETIIYCPKCGKDAGSHQAPIEQKGLGALILLAGIFPFLSYYSTRKKMIKCDSCGFVFLPSTHTDGKGMAGGLLFLLVGFVVAVLLGWFLFLK